MNKTAARFFLAENLWYKYMLRCSTINSLQNICRSTSLSHKKGFEKASRIVYQATRFCAAEVHLKKPSRERYELKSYCQEQINYYNNSLVSFKKIQDLKAKKKD